MSETHELFNNIIIISYICRNYIRTNESVIFEINQITNKKKFCLDNQRLRTFRVENMLHNVVQSNF